MGMNPHANGGLLMRDFVFPISALTLSMCHSLAPSTGSHSSPRADSCEMWCVSIRIRATSASWAQTKRHRIVWDAVFEVTNRALIGEILPTRRSPRAGRPCHGNSKRAPCARAGWKAICLTGRHGFFSCYEAFIHIVDSMFNQHAKWLKVYTRHSVAPPDRVAQLPLDVPRVAAGSQRLQPSGSRLHRSRREQEGRHRPCLPSTRRQHAPLGGRSLPAQQQLCQRHRRGQTAGTAVAGHGRSRSALRGRSRRLGMGEQ